MYGEVGPYRFVVIKRAHKFYELTWIDDFKPNNWQYDDDDGFEAESMKDAVDEVKREIRVHLRR